VAGSKTSIIMNPNPKTFAVKTQQAATPSNEINPNQGPQMKSAIRTFCLHASPSGKGPVTSRSATVTKRPFSVTVPPATVSVGNRW
jgi:hypothetical protein